MIRALVGGAEPSESLKTLAVTLTVSPQAMLPGATVTPAPTSFGGTFGVIVTTEVRAVGAGAAGAWPGGSSAAERSGATAGVR
jgi:hypothetical protein